MRHLLPAVLVVALVTKAFGAPSNYFYRISPAGAPLRKEQVLYAPRPEYPLQARQQHLTGSGLFELHIQRDGSVGRVETIKSIGHPLLDQAAIAAFRRWRFRPHSVAVVRVPIRYVEGPHQPDAVDRRQPDNLGDGVQITVISRSR